MRRPAEVRKLWISLATAQASVLTSTSALGPAAEPATKTPSLRGLGGAVLAVEDLDEAVLVEVDVEHAGDAGGVRRRHHAGREHDQVGAQQLLRAAVMSSTSMTGLPCSSNCTSGGVPRRNSTPARRASRYQFS